MEIPKQPAKSIDLSGGEDITPEGGGKSLQDQIKEEIQADPVVHRNPEVHLSEVSAALFQGEMGIGYVFSRLHHGSFFYNTSDKRWYKFNGYVWEADIKEEVIDAVRDTYQFLTGVKRDYLSDYEDWAEKFVKSVLISITNYSKMLKILDQAKAGKKGLSVNGEECNKHRQYLGAPNGTLDLHNGRLLPGDPNLHITKQVGVPYDPNAPYPEKFLESFLPEVFKYPWAKESSTLTDEDYEEACREECDEIIGFLQILFGYTLLGISTEHIFVCFFGDGRNGKGVLLRLIIKVLGDYAGEIQPEILLRSSLTKSSNAPSEEIMDLKGKRLVAASETNQGAFFDTSVIKRLTGGDTVVGRHNYGRTERFAPTHTVFLQTNFRAMASAEDKAFWRRVYVISFLRRFYEDPDTDDIYQAKIDKKLERELEKELPGILKWVVEGAILYQKKGLKPPMSVVNAVQSYRKSSDLVGDFIEECCVVKPDTRVNKKAFVRTLNSWRNDHGYKKPLQSKVVTEILESKGHGEYKYIGNYCYKGLELNLVGEDYLNNQHGGSAKYATDNPFLDPGASHFNSSENKKGDKDEICFN